MVDKIAVKALLAAKLPNSAIKAINYAKLILTRLYDDVMDGVEQHFLENARLTDDDDQKGLLFSAMDECANKRPLMRQRFLEKFEENLCALVADELASDLKSLTTDKADSLSLSIIEDDDLQEKISLQAMVTATSTNFESLIVKVTAAFDKCLPDVRVTNQNNPVAPPCLGNCLYESFQLTNIDQGSRILIYALFRQCAFKQLGGLYNEIIAIFKREGFTPPPRETGTSSIGREMRDGEPIAVVHQDGNDTLNDGQRGQSARKAGIWPTEETVETVSAETPNQTPGNKISQLLEHGVIVYPKADAKVKEEQDPTVAVGFSDNISVVSISNREVIRLLNQIRVKSSNDYDQLDVSAQLQALLKQESNGDQVKVPGQYAENTINLVALVFQQIMPRLFPLAKPLFSSLQLPIMRLAITDNTLFTNENHCARKVIDSLIQLSIGVDEENCDAYRFLQSNIQNIVDYKTGSEDHFERIQDELSIYLEQIYSELEVRERAAIIELKQQQRRFYVFKTVDSFILNRYEKLTRTLLFHKLMHQVWRHTLSDIYLDAGDDSLEWKTAVTLFKTVLWSTQTKSNEEDNHELLRRLPKLIKGLETLFEQKQVDEDVATRFLDQLREIQLFVMKGGDAETLHDDDLSHSSAIEIILDNISSEIQATKIDTVLIGVDHREVGGKSLIEQKTPLSERDAILQVTGAGVGKWFEYMLEGRLVLCKFMYYFLPLEKYVFGNRRGEKLFERDKQKLIEDVQTAYARPMIQTINFADALENVIESLDQQSLH